MIGVSIGDLVIAMVALIFGDDLELGGQSVQAWFFKSFNVPEVFKGVEWICFLCNL